MLVHSRHVSLSCCIFNLSLYDKIKTWKIWERLIMIRKSLNFTDNQISKKWNNKIKFLWTLVSLIKWKNVLCTFCELFMHFLSTLADSYFEPLLREKCFFQVKVFRVDPNYIKEAWGSFVIISDKKLYVKVLLNDMFIWSFLTCLLDLLSKMFS